MDGGADIVDESGQSELGGAGTAAYGCGRFVNGDVMTGASEDDGGREAVGA